MTLPKFVLHPAYLSSWSSALKVEASCEHRKDVVMVSTIGADKDLSEPGERFGTTCSAHHGVDPDWELEVGGHVDQCSQVLMRKL